MRGWLGAVGALAILAGVCLTVEALALTVSALAGAASRLLALLVSL